jgi:hypothetical protein
MKGLREPRNYGLAVAESEAAVVMAVMFAARAGATYDVGPATAAGGREPALILWLRASVVLIHHLSHK